jgi:glycosyltransferase involved in cell wall biosynthesis
MPELSIVIATLKSRGEVECLDALDRQSFSDYEVLLQDEDKATTARNAGIERAASEKIVFLDDDSLPQEGYLARVSDTLDEHDVVAGKTVHPYDDIFAKHFAGHYSFGETGRYVTRFWGCNMAARKEVFERVGMWDEEISWGHEEVELAERVLTAYPIYYDPKLVVEHPYADSVLDYWKKMYRLEKPKPYLWRKQGLSRREQWIKFGTSLLNPVKYVGRSPRHMVVRAGGHVAKLTGQAHGLLTTRD